MGPLSIRNGVLCLDRAEQIGSVTVGYGASVVLTGSTVRGPLLFNGADAVYLCGNTGGPASISATAGPVFLGGTGCTTNTLTGVAWLADNLGGVVVAGNELNGALLCYGNQPPPQNAGRLNDVRSADLGQCKGL